MMQTEKNHDIVLILPDIHHRVELADKIIRHVGADRVICVGDSQDDFNDTPEMVKNTSEWFVKFVNNPNHIFIGGNHDLMYAFPNPRFRCGGYEDWKYYIINDIVSRKDWDKMVNYHVLDNTWLLTHAGLHNHWVPEEIKNLHKNRSQFLKAITDYLDEEIIKGHRNQSWIFSAGRSRGGFQKVGGLTWCDHYEEAIPVKGLLQVYGHSPQSPEPTWLIKKQNKISLVKSSKFIFDYSKCKPNDAYNLCIDTSSGNYYAIWDGTRLDVKWVGGL